MAKNEALEFGRDILRGVHVPARGKFREREKILDMFEEVCGARLTYSYITPGGCTSA